MEKLKIQTSKSLYKYLPEIRNITNNKIKLIRLSKSIIDTKQSLFIIFLILQVKYNRIIFKHFLNLFLKI